MDKHFHSSRRLYLAFFAFLLATAALVSLPPTLQAHGDVDWIITYYSTPSATTTVGERIYYCDGHLQQWGQVTAFGVKADYPCPGDADP